MNDTSQRKPLVVSEQGVVGSFVALSAVFGQRVVQNTFGGLRDSHQELGTTVDATFGWLDGVQHSGNKIVRGIVRRMFDAGHDGLDFGEQTLMSVIGALRSTGQDATELAARTASSLAVGQRDLRSVS